MTHHIDIGNVDLEHVAIDMLLDILFPHILYCTLWKKTIMYKMRNYASPVEIEYVYKLFGILLHGSFVHFPPLTYLLIYLYQYRLIFVYLFIINSYNIINWSSFNQFLCPSVIPHIVCGYFSILLFSGTVKCSMLILYIPQLQHISMFSEHWLFLLENTIRHQDLCVRVPVATLVYFFQVTATDRTIKYTRVYINTCRYSYS